MASSAVSAIVTMNPRASMARASRWRNGASSSTTSNDLSGNPSADKATAESFVREYVLGRNIGLIQQGY
jgi:hypothetical protein